MEVSVVVVAHNEERHIARCLSSVFAQTLAPAEVLVVAHNCTDATEAIVHEQFPQARVVRLAGPSGTVYAHERGFAEAAFDVTAHLDGDACARDGRWLAELVAPLSDPSVAAVAGVAIYHGNWFVRLGSWVHFNLLYGWLNPLLRLVVPKLRQTVFWSSSYACRKSDYQKVGGLTPLIAGRRAGDEWCEDFYLSHRLRTLGHIVVAHRSVADVESKQQRVRDSLARLARQQGVERRLLRLARQ